MKIKKYTEHIDEGLLKGIPKEKALIIIDEKLEKLKNSINDPNYSGEVFVDLLNNMYTNKEEMMADLMKNGLDAVDILYSIIHDAENTVWNKNKYVKIVHDVMFKMVLNKKDYFINNSELLTDLGY